MLSGWQKKHRTLITGQAARQTVALFTGVFPKFPQFSLPKAKYQHVPT